MDSAGKAVQSQLFTGLYLQNYQNITLSSRYIGTQTLGWPYGDLQERVENLPTYGAWQFSISCPASKTPATERVIAG